MKNKWVFIDETGVLANDRKQPIFALGMLKIEETSILYSDLFKISQRAKSKINQKFEFKFNKITQGNKDLYIDLVDIFFDHNQAFFKCLIIDKDNSTVNPNNYFNDVWEAQISYTKLLLKHTIEGNERVAVIADYLSKPKSSTKYFEKEIQNTERKNTTIKESVVFNSCMLESHASLFIQLVDVLLGLVIYDCKLERGVIPGTSGKTSVLNVLKNRLKTLGNNKSLCRSINANTNPYFGVWLFQPKR